MSDKTPRSVLIVSDQETDTPEMLRQAFEEAGYEEVTLVCDITDLTKEWIEGAPAFNAIVIHTDDIATFVGVDHGLAWTPTQNNALTVVYTGPRSGIERECYQLGVYDVITECTNTTPQDVVSSVEEQLNYIEKALMLREKIDILLQGELGDSLDREYRGQFVAIDFAGEVVFSSENPGYFWPEVHKRYGSRWATQVFCIQISTQKIYLGPLLSATLSGE